MKETYLFGDLATLVEVVQREDPLLLRVLKHHVTLCDLWVHILSEKQAHCCYLINIYMRFSCNSVVKQIELKFTVNDVDYELTQTGKTKMCHFKNTLLMSVRSVTLHAGHRT